MRYMNFVCDACGNKTAQEDMVFLTLALKPAQGSGKPLMRQYDLCVVCKEKFRRLVIHFTENPHEFD